MTFKSSFVDNVVVVVVVDNVVVVVIVDNVVVVVIVDNVVDGGVEAMVKR